MDAGTLFLDMLTTQVQPDGVTVAGNIACIVCIDLTGLLCRRQADQLLLQQQQGRKTIHYDNTGYAISLRRVVENVFNMLAYAC